jgi:hypothetical protein
MANPYDLILPAGKTCVLVDAGTVMLLKDAPADKPTRIFTAWASTIYDTNAAALADIKAKGWKYTQALAPKVPAPVKK